MIENLRKYTGVFMFFLALVLVGLFFFGDITPRNRGAGDGGAFVTIDGRTYSHHEYQQLGENGIRLASNLQMMQFLGALNGYLPEEFFYNRMILRQEAEQFGIYPNDDEVKKSLQTNRLFAGLNGEFNQEAYNNFIKNGLGSLGMTERDVIEIIRDQLLYEKVSKLVGSGLNANKDAVALTTALSRQQISGSAIVLKLSSFSEKLNPSEEEIKKYWEEHVDAYKNPAQRKFAYILVSPVYPPEATPPAPADPSKPDPALAEKTATAETARKKIERDLAERVDTFLSEMEASKGAEWTNLAKEYGWTIHQTESFTEQNLPKELDLKVRNASGPGTVAKYLFEINPTKDELSKFSDAIPVGENQWLVARLESEIPEAPKSFEQARDEARVDLIAQMGKEALQKASTELQAKIKEQLAAGKTFADAAKEAGKEVVNVGPFTAGDRLEHGMESGSMFSAANAVAPGSLTEPVQSEDSTVIFFVSKREVVKQPDQAKQIENMTARMADMNAYVAFNAWLGQAREKAEIHKKAPQR